MNNDAEIARRLLSELEEADDEPRDIDEFWYRIVMLQMEPEFSLLGYNVKPSTGVRNEEAT